VYRSTLAGITLACGIEDMGVEDARTSTPNSAAD
jgi:hypothetical protein